MGATWCWQVAAVLRECEGRGPVALGTLDWPWGWSLPLPVRPAASARQLWSLGVGRAGPDKAAGPGRRLSPAAPSRSRHSPVPSCSVDALEKAARLWQTFVFKGTFCRVEDGDETLLKREQPLDSGRGLTVQGVGPQENTERPNDRRLPAAVTPAARPA